MSCIGMLTGRTSAMLLLALFLGSGVCRAAGSDADKPAHIVYKVDGQEVTKAVYDSVRKDDIFKSYTIEPAEAVKEYGEYAAGGVRVIVTKDVYRQSGHRVFAYDGVGRVVPDSSYIDPFDNGRFTGVKPYVLKSSDTVDAGRAYVVNCSKYKGWENEAGDFNVVEITCGGDTVLTLDNSDAWVRFPYGRGGDGQCPYYVLPLGGGAAALFFKGYTYESPSPLTVVVLKDGRASLVFNKRMVVNGIDDEHEMLFMQEDFTEYVSDDGPATMPARHFLWIKDGMLYFN